MKTILVVDDEYTIVEVLEVLLTGEGFRVIKAADGMEALTRLAEIPVDLVLTDHMMPRLTGAELCARMEADPALRHIPVVLMSATLVTAPSVARCADLLKKPFDFDRLLAALLRVLAEKS